MIDSDGALILKSINIINDARSNNDERRKAHEVANLMFHNSFKEMNKKACAMIFNFIET